MADLTKVQQAVQSINVPGVRNLNARASGNVVEIHGQADSLAAKQNAIREITQRVGDLGLVNKIDVASGQQNAPVNLQVGSPGVSHAAEPKGQTQTQGRTHTVKKGETLSHIAQHYYGKASEYKKIFEANKDQIKDPDKIREGMTLRIP